MNYEIAFWIAVAILAALFLVWVSLTIGDHRVIEQIHLLEDIDSTLREMEHE